MNDPQLRILSAVYDTVDGTGDWPQALAALCDSVHAHGALLALERPGAGVLGHHCHGFEGSWVDTYARDWAPRSPQLARLYGDPALAGRFVAGEELVPYRDWIRSEMFNEHCCHQDVHHTLSLRIATRGGRHLRLALSRDRDAGPAGQAELDSLDALVPHIRRALRLREAFTEGDTATLAMLGERGVPALLLDRSLAIVSANVDGDRWLAGRSPFACRDGVLRARNGALQRRLDKAVRDATTDVGRQSCIDVPRQDPEAGQRLLVAPLDADARGAQRRALVTLVSDDGPLRIAASVLRELHDLTPTEARLARWIASGLGPERAAGLLEVSISTVRWHLKRIFAKTGTAGQTELAAFMQSLARAMPQDSRS